MGGYGNETLSGSPLPPPWGWSSRRWVGLGLLLVVVAGAVAAIAASFDSWDGPPSQLNVVVGALAVVGYGLLVAVLPWPRMVPSIGRFWDAFWKWWPVTRGLHSDEVRSSGIIGYVEGYFTVGLVPWWIVPYWWRTRRGMSSR